MAFGRKKQQSSTEISREELTRTQVLNLQELERDANYERKTSKRPAALFAFAGFLAITMGLLYPNIMMAVDSIGGMDNNSYKVELNKLYDLDATPIATDKIICTLTQPAQLDGTDKVTTKELYFLEQKLQTYVRTITATSMIDNVTGLATVQNMYNTYIAFDSIPVNGYTIATTTENTTTKVEITVDLKTLDRTQLTYNHAANPLTNVEYELNADQATIQNALAAEGYICNAVANEQ